MTTRTIAIATALILAACPTNKDLPPPLPLPTPVVPDPVRIVPAFLADPLVLDGPCETRVDAQGDGEFEDVTVLTVDDDRRVVRAARRVPGVGMNSQVFHRLADGLVHDQESFGTGANYLPNNFGNQHHFYDSGLLARTVYEASDGRLLLGTQGYSYDDDQLVAAEFTSADVSIVLSGRSEYDYVDGQLVEFRRDNGLDGFESTVTYSTTRSAAGRTLVVTTVDDTGTSIETYVIDTFDTMRSFTADSDGDGTIDSSSTAIVTDGVLAGYDGDEDGDGVVDYTTLYDMDEVTHTTTLTTTRAATGARDILVRDYGCYFEEVDRGGCEAPFRDTEAFGCARFRQAVALDYARGSPAIAITPTGFTAVDGFASYPYGVILGAIELCTLDGDPLLSAYAEAQGSPGLIEESDGTITSVGGIRGGMVSQSIVNIQPNGVVSAASTLPYRMWANRAARRPDGSMIITGGVGTTAVALVLDAEGAQIGITYNLTAGAVGGSLSVVGLRSVDVGGDDGEVVPVISDAINVYQDGGGDFVANLPAARTGHRAVVQGEELMIIGGTTPEGVTSSVLRLQFNENEVVITDDTPLPLALDNVGTLVLADGRVLVVGGYLPDGEASAATFVLDNGAWLAGPALKIPRAHARAVLLADGTLAVIGGSLRYGSASSAVEVLELP